MHFKPSVILKNNNNLLISASSARIDLGNASFSLDFSDQNPIRIDHNNNNDTNLYTEIFTSTCSAVINVYPDDDL